MEIKLGRIYKRKREMKLDIPTYPEYVILTSMCDENRYNFFDIMRGKQSIFIMRGSVIDDMYELIEDNRR